jgi:SUN domain-containing protein 1/2
VAGTSYIFVQVAFLCGPSIKYSDELRQEMNFLKTELSNGLLSFRELQRDLSDVLQRVHTEADTSHEVLINLDDTPRNVVDHATDTTETVQMDYALATLGGSIVSTRDSKDYESSWFGPWKRPVERIIHPYVVPGNCWAFEGSGAVVIRLILRIRITGVSIEHVSRSLVPAGAISSAPKDFSVWALDNLHDEGHFLGNFTYDINGSPLQHFPIQQASANTFNLIELRIHGNHGNPHYTCLYRFRVHGSTEHPARA